MVRYAQDHKVETRQRILASAGRRLKRDGIDGSGVATLMKDAGLTNGAFYAHFASKDALVSATVDDQLRVLAAKVEALAQPGRAGLEQVVRWYLSPEHRDDAENGCPNAALLDEISRCSADIRHAYSAGVLVVIDGFAGRIAPADPASARLKALSLLAMMAGTVQLARAITDADLSNELLRQGADNALTLVNGWTAGETAD